MFSIRHIICLFSRMPARWGEQNKKKAKTKEVDWQAGQPQ
jgi:hypothetical protein